MDIEQELRNNAKRFNKVVIWGLKKKWHTHRFIFQAYYQNLKKCGIPVVWVEDEKESQGVIEKGDIIFSASGMHGKMVPEKLNLADYNLPIRDDVYYCLHAENQYFVDKINPDKALQLKFYNNDAERFERLYDAVHFDRVTKTLYQPWGTNLLPREFKKPTFCRLNVVFWVGSVWKGKQNEGNVTEIGKFVNVLKSRYIRFVHIRFVPNFINTFLVRHSRLAPAIGGEVQVQTNYLPCRMFKNISYGQLGFSNIVKFNDIFKGCSVYDQNMECMVDMILDLKKADYIELVKKQQEVCKRYTIAHHLNNIFKYI